MGIFNLVCSANASFSRILSAVPLSERTFPAVPSFSFSKALFVLKGPVPAVGVTRLSCAIFSFRVMRAMREEMKYSFSLCFFLFNEDIEAVIDRQRQRTEDKDIIRFMMIQYYVMDIDISLLEKYCAKLLGFYTGTMKFYLR